ncbi:MAG: SIMPL domain-containing protein [Ardenticatenaceae bacterium]|nr:SIMPL domain-containing protein [Ardenticatenaceae bacterium]
MNVTQAIQNPLGVTVFGSAVLRVEPDVASLNFTVSRLEQHPKDAFAATRKAVQKVRDYLTQAGIEDVGSSRINLSQSFRYVGGENTFLGYQAEISFHLLLSDLERMEEILSGVVDAGVNKINAVAFQTTRLKELRAEARRRAVAAAQEKAEIYCAAAGVTLGNVIHIEDVNPEQLRGREGHMAREAIKPDDDGPLKAFDPGSIVVGGAVMVTFALAE